MGCLKLHSEENYTQMRVVYRKGKRVGTPFPDDIADAITYNLEDQIGSSVARLDTNGTIIDCEEYYPFGDSSLRTFTKKRYRYVGKEKDLESGLYYYGARYYAAWTCRFISIDPLAHDYPFYTPYNYAGNKPINKIDIDGMQEQGATTKPQEGTEGGAVKGAEEGDQNIDDPAVVKEMEQKMHALDEKYNKNGKEEFSIKYEIQTQNGESRYEISVLDKNNLVIESSNNFSNKSTQHNSVEGVNDIKIVQPENNSSERQNNTTPETKSPQKNSTIEEVDNANTIIGTALSTAEYNATITATQTFKYAQNIPKNGVPRIVSPQVLTRVNSMFFTKIAKVFSILGITLGLVGVGISSYQLYDYYQQTGEINNWYAADLTVGIIDSSIGILATIGTIVGITIFSVPTLVFITVASVIYGLSRLFWGD